MLINCCVEKPVPWLKSKLDGERNRLMYSALLKELSDRYLYQETSTDFRHEFEKRSAPPNGFCLSYHSVGDVRHVWRIKETPIPYFYSFDRLGFSAWSEIAQFPEFFREKINALPLDKATLFVDTLKEYLLKNNFSKYQQEDYSSIKFPENFIFFPLQMRSDIVFQFCKIDPLKVAAQLAKISKKRKQYLVIKRHPFCTSKKVSLFLKWISLNNPYVIISNASINELLPKCSSVVVANSGVGLEAMIYQKKVFSFAQSEYSIASENFDNLDMLEELIEKSFSPDFSIKFIYFYLNYFCFDARSSPTISQFLNLVEFSLKNELWCEEKLPFIYNLMGMYE